MPNNKIIVFHPGHVQVAYQASLALQQNGSDYKFITGIYYKNNYLNKILVKILPTKITNHIINKRKLSDLNDNNISVYPFWEIIYLISVRIKFLKKYSEKIMRLRNEKFDKLVSKIVLKNKPKIVYGYNGSSLFTFRVAKQEGIICILDSVIGHFQHGNSLLSEEKKLLPEFSDSIVLDLNHSNFVRAAEEISLADWILVASNYARDTFIKHGVPSSKLLLCQYGVDINQFLPMSLKNKSEYFVVLFIGQISQRKGIKYLLEAISSIKISKIKLVFIGKFIGDGEWIKNYPDLNIEHIEYVNYSKLHEYYQSADIFVYPSLHEGSALAIYEALACGLPVITTHNSGSVIENGIEGFIVPIRDVYAITDKIYILYRDADLRRSISINARLKAQNFTWAHYRVKLAKLINNLV